MSVYSGTTGAALGHLDAFGSARLDVAPGTLPAGLAFDAIVLLQDPNGAVTTLTRVLEFDT